MIPESMVFYSTAALECARQAYQVQCWSNTFKAIDGVRTLAGLDSLPEILAGSDILVCMLPETPHTRGLLNAERLALLKAGAAFINVSRGRIVDEHALIDALRSGHIAEATLDVFATEPLLASSPLWEMDAASCLGRAAGLGGGPDWRECAEIARGSAGAEPRRPRPGILSSAARPPI
jgi:phosphoglycerate dehydrogenase-like enzyme